MEISARLYENWRTTLRSAFYRGMSTGATKSTKLVSCATSLVIRTGHNIYYRESMYVLHGATYSLNWVTHYRFVLERKKDRGTKAWWPQKKSKPEIYFTAPKYARVYWRSYSHDELTINRSPSHKFYWNNAWITEIADQKAQFIIRTKRRKNDGAKRVLYKVVLFLDQLMNFKESDSDDDTASNFFLELRGTDTENSEEGILGLSLTSVRQVYVERPEKPDTNLNI